MKKFVVLIFSVFCFSLVSNAQTIDKEEIDQMREQMEGQMENMMKHLEKSFDMMEGSVTMMDTIMFKHFGTMGEDGEFVPNEKIESIMKEMEGMMKDAFGDINLEELMPNGIPGPDELEEDSDGKPKQKKQNGKSKDSNKKKRKTSRL